MHGVEIGIVIIVCPMVVTVDMFLMLIGCGVLGDCGSLDTDGSLDIDGLVAG
jgi:hypothetical protein